MEILNIENITKSFDGKKIIDNISFSIKKGRIVGLLGINGSGKTTILKLINDLLTLDSGKITIMGEKVSEKSKAMVSFLPERPYFDTCLNIKQTFDYFEDFYADFDRKKAENLLKDLDLTLDMGLSKMSKGMKEKLQLILVMSRKAKLYILDEPLGGVDPATRDYILKTIISNFDENSSVLITTHLISDVEKILDDVVIINKGKVLVSSSCDVLREKEKASINDIFRRIVKWLEN